MEHDARDPRAASPAAERGAVIAFAVIAAAALAGVVITGSVEFVFYLVVMLALGGAVWWIHRRVGFPAALLGCLVAWAGLHMAGGLVPTPPGWPVAGDQRVLYSLWIVPAGGQPADDATGWLKYDNVVHAFGFGVITWACWCGLAAAFRGRGLQAPHPTIGLLTLVGAAGLGCGALNEVVEFVATLFADTNVGGYVNTGWDLVSNLVGVLIACVALRLAGRGAEGAESGSADRA